MSQHSVAERERLGLLLASRLEMISEEDLRIALSASDGRAEKSSLEQLCAQGKLTALRRDVLRQIASELLDVRPNISALDKAFAPADTALVTREMTSESSPSAGPEQIDETAVQDGSSQQSAGNEDWSLVSWLRSGTAVGKSASREMRELAVSAGKRYEVLEAIARGGLGSVSIALDRELNRKVALKQIRPDHADNSVSQRRFVLEAEVTGMLEHPGIVPVYSLGQDAARRPFYAMRLIEGESLKSAIRHYFDSPSRALRSTANGRHAPTDREAASATGEHSSTSARPHATSPQPTSRVMEFRKLLGHFVDLCNAIHYAHSRGIIHRDIKPANVMVGPFGETIVVDWGLARRTGQADEPAAPGTNGDNNADGLTGEGDVLGTLVYMAPEQAAGEASQIGPAADIYALGATLYELLTGRPAFRSADFRDRDELLSAVRTGKIAPPTRHASGAPRALEAVCLKAMNRSIESRYQTAKELASDIESWLADEPVTAWREPVTIRARRWMRRHRALVTSSVAAMVTSIVALGVVAGLQRESNRQLASANAEVNQSRQLAERQFDLATRAIGQYHSGVSADFLLAQPEFAELRGSLLEQPRQFYRDLAAIQQEVDEPSFEQRLALADSHRQLARLAEEINDAEAAIDENRHVVQLLDGMIDDYPDRPQLVVQKAETLTALANACVSVGNHEEADNHFRAADTAAGAALELLPDDPAAMEVRAENRADHATFLATTGRHAESRDGFVVAEETFRQLLARDPDNGELLNGLAICLDHWSNLEWDLEEIKSAIERAEESLAIQKKLAADSDQESRHLATAGGIMTNLAYLCQLDGRKERALELYNEAEQAFASLVETAPNVFRFQSGLASTLTNKGLLLVDEKDFEQAEEYYRRALRIKERLAEDFPDAVENVLSLAGGYVNFGGQLHHRRELDEAVEWYDKAIPVLDRLLENHPDLFRAKVFLGNVHGNRARALRSLERHREAADGFRLAIECADDGEIRDTLTSQLMQSMAQCDLHAEGSELAVQGLETAESDEDYYNLAFIHALALKTVQADESMNDEDREQAAATYTGRAVAALRGMFATGVLSETQFLSVLTTNPYLEPLYQRDEYQQLVDEFEQ